MFMGYICQWYQFKYQPKKGIEKYKKLVGKCISNQLPVIEHQEKMVKHPHPIANILAKSFAMVFSAKQYNEEFSKIRINP